MKRYVVMVALALSLVALFAITAGPALACEPLSPGYWMNHPEAWPCQTLTFGCDQYTQADAIALMRMPTRGDMTLAMFQAAAAARLNELSGCPLNDPGAYWMCTQWVQDHDPGMGVSASSGAWQSVERDYWTLVSWWEPLD